MDWGSLGYTGACGVDGFPLPGEIMRQKRIELGMSQEALAGLLGASRSMVARMEKNNHGLDSITTRRQVSKVLGIAPVMLGVVSIEEVASKAASLYSTAILKRSFQLYREAYFAGGNVGGTAEVEEMVQHIFDISTTLGHTNKEVLSIISQYAQLGAAIAREEQKYAAAGRFAQMCLSISRQLGDQILTVGGLMQHSSVLYGRGDSTKAKKYIDEALAQKKIPTTVQGAVYLDASRIYSRLGQFQSANKYLDQAVSIAKQTSGTHPVGVINADLAFCHLRAVRTFLDQKDYHTAIEMAELADKEVSPKFVRRRGLIPIMYAQILLETGDYEGALTYANNALSIAKELNEPLILAHLLYIRNRLQSVYRTRETRVFDSNLAEVVGTRKIIPMAY